MCESKDPKIYCHQTVILKIGLPTHFVDLLQNNLRHVAYLYSNRHFLCDNTSRIGTTKQYSGFIESSSLKCSLAFSSKLWNYRFDGGPTGQEAFVMYDKYDPTFSDFSIHLY